MPQTGFRTWLQVVLVLALVVAWPLGAGVAALSPAPPPLTQNFIAKGGAFTFSFPRGWVHGADSGAITLGNNQEALAAINGEVAPGHIAVLIWPTTADVAAGWDLEVTGKSRQDVLKELMASGSDVKFTLEPTDTTVGDKPATMVKAQAKGRDTLVLLVDTGPDNVTAVAAGAAIGEMSQHESIVLAIAATISYHGTGAAPVEGAGPTPTPETGAPPVVGTGATPVVGTGAPPVVGTDATPQAAVELTQDFVSEDGAFTFKYPQGWVHGTENGAIVVANTQAALDNVNGEGAPGQIAVMIWPTTAAVAEAFGSPPEAKTHQEVLTALLAEDNHPKFTQEPTDATVGDKPATRMMTQTGGRDTLMLFVDTGPGNVSAVLGGAAVGELPRFEPTVLAIAATLSYGAAAPAEQTGAADGWVHQWATQVEATSEYGTTQWNAMQAAGKPNTPGCKDSKTAWASKDKDTAETLTLHYDQFVTPTEVNIHQTYNPGAITSVELLLADGVSAVPVPDSADPDTTCPHVFKLKAPPDTPPVNGVIIHLDQSLTGDWSEIDAVELVGK